MEEGKTKDKVQTANNVIDENHKESLHGIISTTDQNALSDITTPLNIQQAAGAGVDGAMPVPVSTMTQSLPHGSTTAHQSSDHNLTSTTTVSPQSGGTFTAETIATGGDTGAGAVFQASPPSATAPVDSIISRLLGLRGSPPGTLASIAENEIKLLCQLVRPILLQQPMLLELEAPIKICGDVHGQFTDLLRLFEYGGFPPESNFVFLGDYVDRGKQSIETICLLLSYKVKHPERFFLLRGNHESAGINRIYGFYDECKRRYSIKLWKIFSDCFNCLPVSALIDEKILCMHGGLSPELNEGLFQIADLPRPCDVPDVGLMCDLLWSDPDTSITVSEACVKCVLQCCTVIHLIVHFCYYNATGLG
jgi:hypothetical protein